MLQQNMSVVSWFLAATSVHGWFRRRDRLAVIAALTPGLARVVARMSAEEFKTEMSRRRSEGLALRGETFDVKQEIKQADGVWDRYEKAWLMPSADAIIKLAKKLNMDAERQRGGWYLSVPRLPVIGPRGLTYDNKDTIKKHGGRWDGRQWMVRPGDVESLRKALAPDVTVEERNNALYLVEPSELSERRAANQPRATPKQIEFALNLIDQIGEDWMGSQVWDIIGPPPTRAQLSKLTKSALSGLIDQMKDELRHGWR